MQDIEFLISGVDYEEKMAFIEGTDYRPHQVRATLAVAEQLEQLNTALFADSDHDGVTVANLMDDIGRQLVTMNETLRGLTETIWRLKA